MADDRQPSLMPGEHVASPVNSPFDRFILGIARGVLWWVFPLGGVMVLTSGRNVDKNPGFYSVSCGLL